MRLTHPEQLSAARLGASHPKVRGYDEDAHANTRRADLSYPTK